MVLGHTLGKAPLLYSLLHSMILQEERTERKKMSLEDRERWREMRAEEREKDKVMIEGALQKCLSEAKGVHFPGNQPPTC